MWELQISHLWRAQSSEMWYHVFSRQVLMWHRQQCPSKLQHPSSQLRGIVSQKTTILSRVLLKHRLIYQCEVKHNTCSYLAWKLSEFTANSCLLFLHARYPCQTHTRSIFCVFMIYKQQDQFIRVRNHAARGNVWKHPTAPCYRTAVTHLSVPMNIFTAIRSFFTL